MEVKHNSTTRSKLAILHNQPAGTLMQHVSRPVTTLPLHGPEASRRIEQFAQAALPPHTLMRRAGLAVARLALALARA